jgi:hypothetical protein
MAFYYNLNGNIFRDEVRGVSLYEGLLQKHMRHAPQQIALPPDVQSVLHDLVTHQRKRSELNRDFAYFTIAKQQATLFCCTENRWIHKCFSYHKCIDNTLRSEPSCACSSPSCDQDQIDNYRRSKMVKGCGMCEITQEWYPANELHVDHDFDKMVSDALGRFQIVSRPLYICKRRRSQVQRWKGNTSVAEYHSKHAILRLIRCEPKYQRAAPDAVRV